MESCNEREQVVTAAQMKAIEAEANARGLSYYQMMENAGFAAYHMIRERYPKAEALIILAGKGNNGGDGFVVARLAQKDGLRVIVSLVEGNPVTEDAILNVGLVKNRAAAFKDVSALNGLFRDIPGSLSKAQTVIVDAIYGTGFHGDLRPAGKAACQWINSMECPVVSLDVPSGVNADTAAADPDAVRADLTIAFHLKKPVHTDPSAAAFCGEVVTADIGI